MPKRPIEVVAVPASVAEVVRTTKKFLQLAKRFSNFDDPAIAAMELAMRFYELDIDRLAHAKSVEAG